MKLHYLLFIMQYVVGNKNLAPNLIKNNASSDMVAIMQSYYSSYEPLVRSLSFTMSK